MNSDSAYTSLVAAYTEIVRVLNTLNPLLPEVAVNTPRRSARALLELSTPEAPPTLTCFEEHQESDCLVVQNGIQVVSLCEHHLLPFFGTATVAYLPSRSKHGQRILGLSKLARLVKYVARGPNVQERITQRVVDLLYQSGLQPVGVGVSLRCHHTCMSIRGVKDINAVTETECLTGVFRSDPAVRAEFLAKVRHSPFFASA